MVLNHAGERLIIQSNAAKVIERPKRIIAGPAHLRQRAVIAASPLNGTGVRELLDLVVDATPAPLGREHATEAVAMTTGADGNAVARVLRTVVDPFVGHLSIVKVMTGRLGAGALGCGRD